MVKIWMNNCLVAKMYDYAAEGISNLLRAGETTEEKEAWKYLLNFLLLLTSLCILFTPYELFEIENTNQYYLSLIFIHFVFLSLGCIYQLKHEDKENS
jgi:hypothetical protein